MPPAESEAGAWKGSLRSSSPGSSLRTAQRGKPTSPVPGTMRAPSTELTPGLWTSLGRPGVSPRGWPLVLLNSGKALSTSLSL
eukprot:2705038-Alexandrium_andersonii.AAC.1